VSVTDATATDTLRPDVPALDRALAPDVQPVTCPAGQALCGATCLPVGGPCSVGVGACARTGTLVCTGTTTACNASPGAPSPEQCNNVDDDCDGTIADECGIWRLSAPPVPNDPRRPPNWTVYPFDYTRSLDPARVSRHAPTAPIVATFDIESLRVMYVFTQNTWHVLDLDPSRWNQTDGQWRESGSVESLGLLSDPAARAYWMSGVQYAWSVPSWHADPQMPSSAEGLVFTTRSGALTYSFDLASRRFRFDEIVPVASIRWEGHGVPGPANVRGMWLDTHNLARWVTDSPASICGNVELPASTDEFYAVHLTATHVHFMDAGYCFRFFGSMPIEMFGPFRLPNAPPRERITDPSFNRDELWIVRNP
jgi:hypothetical protein